MRFLYVTDSHLKGKNPINRKGNFTQDILDKHIEVCRLAKELNCEMVLHGGDLFDYPLVSLNTCDLFVDIVEMQGIPWYILFGNHDEIGNNPNLSGSSMLGHIFKRSSLINRLEIIQNEKVLIQGYDYYHNIENDILQHGLMARDKSFQGKKIAVVHAYIVEKPLPYHHCLISQIPCCDYDLVLTGHYHSEIGIIRHHGTTFVGIGAISRLSLSKSDIHHQPKVLFLDTQVPTMKIIPLKSVKPASEVFYLERKEEVIEHQRNIDQFISSLEGTKYQSLNLSGIIQEIADKKSCEKEVIEEIIKRIGEAENGNKL